MNNIATMTVIRGTGACDVMINGVLQKEVARLNEEHEKEMRIVSAELRSTKKRCKKLLADRLDGFVKSIDKSETDVKENISLYLAMVLHFAEKWGLVEYVRNEDE